MAGHRKPMIDIKRIIQLKLNGESNRRIGALIGIDRKTVNEYVSHLIGTGKSMESLFQMEDSILQSLLPQTRMVLKDTAFQQLLQLIPEYETELKKPGFTYQELWLRYKSSYPEGYGSTQFKIHLQKALGLHSSSDQATLHMEYVFGEKLFADFCGDHLETVDRETGEIVRKESFVAILPASGITYVEATEDQKKASFLRCLTHALEYFSGVPKLIITDNLKSAVTQAHTYEPILNKDFKAFGLHYNTALMPTRGYKPKDKALVEGAVKLVYQRIYYPLQGQLFFTLSDLNAAIRPLLEAHNSRPYTQRPFSRREWFETNEKALLGSLPPNRFTLLTYKKATIQKNYHVYLSADKHYYSVPYQHIGEVVEVRYNDYLVEVYSRHSRICSHERKRDAPGRYSTLSSHMPPNHQYVKGWSKEYFLNWARQISPEVLLFLEKVFLISDHPEQAYKSCSGIQNLYRVYKGERLSRACTRAMAFERIGYRVLSGILKSGLDLTPELPLEPMPLPSHDNVRGASYYH